MTISRALAGTTRSHKVKNDLILCTREFGVESSEDDVEVLNSIIGRCHGWPRNFDACSRDWNAKRYPKDPCLVEEVLRFVVQLLRNPKYLDVSGSDEITIDHVA